MKISERYPNLKASANLITVISTGLTYKWFFGHEKKAQFEITKEEEKPSTVHF